MTSSDDRTMRVLLVEGDDSTSELFLAAIADGNSRRGTEVSFDLTRVSTLEGAFGVLERLPHAAVVLDLALLGRTGLEPLRHVLNSHPEAAVIVLTALDDHDLATSALRLGAQDHLVKGHFDGPSIVRTLLYAVARAQSRTGDAHDTRTLGHLAREVAHDFNDLLTIILGHAESLRADVVPSGGMGVALGEISEAAHQAANLTKRLVALGGRAHS